MGESGCRCPICATARALDAASAGVDGLVEMAAEAEMALAWLRDEVAAALRRPASVGVRRWATPTGPVGFVVLTRQPDGSWRDDWDGEVHATGEAGEAAMLECARAGHESMLVACHQVATAVDTGASA
jgi:hypothetical protein